MNIKVIMNSIYQIQGSPVESQYHGCGPAWAAIKDGQVQAIRYMDDRRATPAVDRLPNWARAVLSGDAHPVVYRFIDAVPASVLGAAKKAAIAAGHPATGPKGGYIPARRIVGEAWALYLDASREDFGAYRLRCRAELAELGEVVSGMLSCWEFLPGR